MTRRRWLGTHTGNGPPQMLEPIEESFVGGQDSWLAQQPVQQCPHGTSAIADDVQRQNGQRRTGSRGRWTESISDTGIPHGSVCVGHFRADPVSTL